MNMVKDLLTREELRYIKRVLELLPEDTPVTYEIGAIGYNKDKAIMSTELFLRVFNELDEAIEYTKAITVLTIMNADTGETYDNTTINRISVEVSATIDDYENRTINLGTVYRKIINLK
jgi:hydroxymethylpyrimidine pyrophosphatase-like HAD family hydrolase